jgi:hypothetical protein
VFQGSFTITNNQNNSQKLLLFRCESYLDDKMDILGEFSPDNYQFTHLLSGQFPILLEEMDDKLEKALYLLKYALKTSLAEMINRSKHRFTYMDEVSIAHIAQRIKKYMDSGKQRNMDDDIGFAVSIDFTPHEEEGKMAATALWEINVGTPHLRSMANSEKNQI